MITVPHNFSEGYKLLQKCPSGLTLLARQELANVQGIADAGLNAYGSAIDKDTIHLPTFTLAAPHQACILMHELTHCLDMAFWGITRSEAKKAMIGATEINAHYNQGLIARELAFLAKSGAIEEGTATEVEKMNANQSVFGKMKDMRSRDNVYRYLLGTEQYGDSVRELSSWSNILYTITQDNQWTLPGINFHCEYHLDKNTKELRGEGYW